MAHGGSTRKGKRKLQRPFVPRKPMHLVLRSSKARGALSLLRHDGKIDAILRGQAAKHFVKLQSFVNVGNHLHLKVKANSRAGFQAFLISASAMIARAVTGARRGRGFGKFWDALAYTRVLITEFEEKTLDKYFSANALEAVFGRQIREIFLGKRLLGAG